MEGRTDWQGAGAPGTGTSGQGAERTDKPPAAIVVASPNYLGCIDPLGPARETADRLGALLVAAFDPVAAGLLRTPGEQGADVAVAEGQPLGTPLAFGGPYLGMFAVAAEHVRRLPGRLVGRTVDGRGRTAYVTTLRAREQDIRRERASSNICTNQTLIAVAAMVQLGWLGTHGLRELALRCARGTRYARDALIALPGVRPLVEAPVVREFALQLPLPAEVVVDRMAEEGFLAGVPVEAGGPQWIAHRRDREADACRDRRLRGCHGEGGVMNEPSSGIPVTDRPSRKRPGHDDPASPLAAEEGHGLRNGRDGRRGAAPAGKASSAPLLGHDEEPTIFDFSVPGRRAASFRTTQIPEWTAEELLPPEELRPSPPDVAEVSERDLVAHVTRLTHRQYSVDLGAYPLGSCTMKYNPKICDEAAALPGLGNVHPATPAPYAQGWLELLWSLADTLCRITGMHAATLQPPAGAAGELTGLLIMRAWHNEQGRSPAKVLIPDSAHGTNPASVSLAGYRTVSVPSDESGAGKPGGAS